MKNYHLKYITAELRDELFGDLDVFDFGNIYMFCLGFATIASLALYAFCVYCI